MKKLAATDALVKLQVSVVKFRDARDWEQLHNPMKECVY